MSVLDFRKQPETLCALITRREYDALWKMIYGRADMSWPPSQELQDRLFSFLEKVFERHNHAKSPAYDRRKHLIGDQVVEVRVASIAQLKFHIEL